MFLLDVYADAHDEYPVRTLEATGVGTAVLTAARTAESLADEACRLQVGAAGEDELFEMFPDPGHGTVVVREVGRR